MRGINPARQGFSKGNNTMKKLGDRGEIDSGLGGVFTVVIAAEADADGLYTVKVDNHQSDFHGQVYRVPGSGIRPPGGLVPREALERLKRNAKTGEIDPIPVLKLTAKSSGAVWLLTEIKDDLDTSIGLCDCGQGFPKLGSISLFDLARANLGVIAPVVRREAYFFPDASLAVYAQAAEMAEKTTFHGPMLMAAYHAILKERGVDGGRQPWLAPSVARQ